MAESIANALGAQGPSPTPRAVRSWFISTARFTATTAWARRRGSSAGPKSNVKVISVVPVENLDAINVDEYRKRGDFIVFTLKPPASQ